MTGGWRKLYNEEFNNLYSEPGIFRMKKSSRVRESVHAARMGKKGNA
jgi:hypothetical protein